MNATMPVGAIPAKVSESDRANVTAGLAKDVEAVNLSFPKIPSGPDSHRKTESSHH
jgi:hypothetical protein